MGDEVPEESESEPMFDITCKPKLGGKKIALFGLIRSRRREWMRN